MGILQYVTPPGGREACPPNGAKSFLSLVQDEMMGIITVRLRHQSHHGEMVPRQVACQHDIKISTRTK